MCQFLVCSRLSILITILLTSQPLCFVAVTVAADVDTSHVDTQQKDLQTTHQPEIETLDPVVVTATRTPKAMTQVPGAVTAINQKQLLQANPATGIDETLRAVPGVYAERRFGPDDVRISIRGTGQRATFGTRGVRVLIDGIPLTEPDGQTRLEPIDLDAISRVEVLRGPNSALYGNASAGVINYVIEEGSSDNQYIETRFTFGAYDFFKSRIKTAGVLLDNRLSYMGSYSFVESDGYRDHSTVRNQRFFGKLKYRIDDESDVSLIVTYSRPNIDIPGSLTKTQAETNPRQTQQTLHAVPPAAFPRTTPFSSFDPQRKDERFRPSLTYRNQFTPNQEISLTGFFGTRDLNHPLCCFTGSFLTTRRVEWGSFVKYTNSTPILGLPNRLIIGYDYQDQNSVNKNFDNVLGRQGTQRVYNQARTSQDGFYVQDEFSPFKMIELIAGVRYSQVRFKIQDNIPNVGGNSSGRRNFAETTPMGGIRFSPVEWANFYGSISTAFESPTSTEFRNPNNAAGVGFNPGVKPQKSTNYEVGIKGTVGESFYYEMAVYRQRFRDELIPFNSPGPCFFVQCFRNAGKSDHDGFELGVTYRPIPGLTLQTAYTYSDYRFRTYTVNGVDVSGRRLPGIPEHRIVFDTTYAHPSGFYGGAEWLYQTGYFINDTNQESTATGAAGNDQKNPSYTVTNLKAGFNTMIGSEWELEIFSRVDNIFDANYFTSRLNPGTSPSFSPFPGRNVFGGFSMRYLFLS
ncbi:MAG: TonB-dependent receptor [Nitrospirales bacterium]|nr:MAG: TonB-dependent receptor [Nitrospirales bacterium]